MPIPYNFPQDDQQLLQSFISERTANTLFAELGNLRQILDADASTLRRAGASSIQIQRLRAIREISTRDLGIALLRENNMRDPQTARKFLLCKLRQRRSEVFAVMLLDNKHRLIEYKELFFGTIDGASVYPRDVVYAVMEANAAAVIFAHNHPSGDTEPSQADIRITERLKSALKLIDVRVLDHIIIGDGKPTSFAEKGLI